MPSPLSSLFYMPGLFWQHLLQKRSQNGTRTSSHFLLQRLPIWQQAITAMQPTCNFSTPSAPLDFALDYDVQPVAIRFHAMIYSHCAIFLASQRFVFQITNCLSWIIEVQEDVQWCDSLCFALSQDITVFAASRSVMFPATVFHFYVFELHGVTPQNVITDTGCNGNAKCNNFCHKM